MTTWRQSVRAEVHQQLEMRIGLIERGVA